MGDEKRNTFLWYLVECLIGTMIGYAIYKAYPVVGAWCLFSIVLVIAPDRKDANLLAMNRIKANLIGAGVGLTLFYLHPITLPMICAGIAVAMTVCEVLKLQAVARSATIAVLIITLHEPGQAFWDVALERTGGVIVGCGIGVVLTYAFHHAMTQSRRWVEARSQPTR